MLSCSVFSTVFFPILKNEDVVSQPVKACTAGNNLHTNHKEADTRMLLHAIHADARFGNMNVKGRIIIKSPDTDVLLLCIHFFPSMRNTKELWFKTGTVTRTKDGRRYLPVFSTVFFPILKNEDVVSQPVKACTAGNNLHTRGPWIWQISWTGR
jgi:hypothetical protein